jgi:acetoin utilization deacetylase AcuC-like enzyme
MSESDREHPTHPSQIGALPVNARNASGLVTAIESRGLAPSSGSAFLHPSVVDGYSDLWDRPERVTVPFAHVRRSALWTALRELPVEYVHTPAAIARIHPQAYATRLAEHEVLYEPAVDACAAVLSIGRAVARGDVRNGYALVRPAGHHAGASTSGGGGCLLANSAILARELQALGFERIAIVDWDAHHGNGPQDIFWNDGSVLTVSLHQARTVWLSSDGSIDAVGSGPGLCCNANLPFEPGAGGAAFALAMRSVVAPLCARFGPDFIIVSCGFDASNVDPSARLQLCAADYFNMTKTVMDVAETHCDGRMVLLHEGGYAVSYVAVCLESVLRALAGWAPAHDPYAERWGSNFAGQPRSSDLQLVSGVAQRFGLRTSVL